jgi:hypothetical protein
MGGDTHAHSPIRTWFCSNSLTSSTGAAPILGPTRPHCPWCRQEVASHEGEGDGGVRRAIERWRGTGAPRIVRRSRRQRRHDSPQETMVPSGDGDGSRRRDRTEYWAWGTTHEGGRWAGRQAGERPGSGGGGCAVKR